MATIMLAFAWFFNLIGIDMNKVESTKGRYATLHIVSPRYLGSLLLKYATRLSSIEMGYDGEIGKFAVIVANVGVDRSKVSVKLPEGYMQIAGIKRTGGTMFGRVIGNVVKFVNDKAFFTGIESILLADFADGDINFRHADTKADDIVVIQFRMVDFETYTSDDLSDHVVILETPDGDIVRFIETIGNVDYLLTNDAFYRADGSMDVTTAQDIVNDKGVVMTINVLDQVETPVNAEPVTMLVTKTGMLLGYDDGTSVFVKIDEVTKEVTAIAAKTEYGAIIALDLVMDGSTNTAIFDDGTTMQRMPLTVLDPAMATALVGHKATTGPTQIASTN